MNKQVSFSDIEHGNCRKKTRKEVFLQTMDRIIPWQRLCELIKPHYYSNKTGRPAIGAETMLRMYLLQIWFNLSDELTEDSIIDSHAMRDFVKINLLHQQAPDSTTLMQFRHLLEAANLQSQIQNDINKLLEEKNLVMHGGTIADASIFEAASSTRNETKSRDSEMHSTKKGNNYYFGMKAHIGVDAGTGAVVNTAFTAANEHDVTQAHKCYREDDHVRYGDSAYTGAEKRPEIQKMDEGKEIEYRTNKRRKTIQEKHDMPQNWEKSIEARKSAVRGKVEYPFYIVKRVFGCATAIYKGLEKNSNRLRMAFSSANLYMFRYRLETHQGGILPI